MPIKVITIWCIIGLVVVGIGGIKQIAANKTNDDRKQSAFLEMENKAIKSKDYTCYYQKVKPMSYQILYIIGASIAGAALLGAFIIYLVKGKKTY